MVISTGKSRKNVDAYVLFPPDAHQAVDLLNETRSRVGISPSNPYIFARLSGDSPLTGNTDLQKVVQCCTTLKERQRITETNLRKYIGTVSQVTYPISIINVQNNIVTLQHGSANFFGVEGRMNP